LKTPKGSSNQKSKLHSKLQQFFFNIFTSRDNSSIIVYYFEPVLSLQKQTSFQEVWQPLNVLSHHFPG